jgi:putative tryptophan/tyrosine transport system substrate-binding protein
LVTALRYAASLPTGSDLKELDQLKRRSFITLLGGAAAWPTAARAQQPAMPAIGYLSSGSPAAFAPMVAALRRGLTEAGVVEGRDYGIEFRWAEGQYERLPPFAADFVRRKVTVIVATGGSDPALAAKSATSTIPIVFTGGLDPVELGLVASLARPSGNVTGTINIAVDLSTKRLEILRQLVPTAKIVAVLSNQNGTGDEIQLREVEAAAQAVGQRILVFNANNDSDFDTAFESMVRRSVGALFVNASPFFTSQRKKLVALAARHAIPASYSFREFAIDGGLMTYGTSIPDQHRQAGVYAGRILKGEKPANLPVLRPTKFELVINLKTARALGLDVPDKLLALADEVIE